MIYYLKKVTYYMLVNKEANYHVKREKGGLLYPVKSHGNAPVPTMMVHSNSKEIKEKNLSTMMSSDLDNILEINQHFP